MPSRKRRDFVAIQRSMLQDVGYDLARELGAIAAWLLVCLINEADHRTGFVAGDGEREFARRFGMNRQTYRKHIGSLQARGFVKVSKAKNQFDARGGVDVLCYREFTGDVGSRSTAGPALVPDQDRQRAMTSSDAADVAQTRPQDFGSFDSSVRSSSLLPQQSRDEERRRRQHRPKTWTENLIDQEEEWRAKRERARSLQTEGVGRHDPAGDGRQRRTD